MTMDPSKWTMMVVVFVAALFGNGQNDKPTLDDLINASCPSNKTKCFAADGACCLNGLQFCNEISRACETPFNKTEVKFIREVCCRILEGEANPRPGQVQVCKDKYGWDLWWYACETGMTQKQLMEVNCPNSARLCIHSAVGECCEIGEKYCNKTTRACEQAFTETDSDSIKTRCCSIFEGQGSNPLPGEMKVCLDKFGWDTRLPSICKAESASDGSSDIPVWSILVTIVVIAVVIGLILLAWFLWKRHQKRKNPRDKNNSNAKDNKKETMPLNDQEATENNSEGHTENIHDQTLLQNANADGSASTAAPETVGLGNLTPRDTDNDSGAPGE